MNHAQNITNLDQLKENIDHFFLLIMGMIVFFMQSGFAFLECGSLQSKNVVNILLKNFLDSLIAGISYWAIGYPLAYGERSVADGGWFAGWAYWFSYGLNPKQYSFWFYQFAFAATSATIVSGAAAERCEFLGYIVYSFLMTGFVYPVVSHWHWCSYGWLNDFWVGGDQIKFLDFAGSGVVHVTGGVAALAAAATLGPRLCRRGYPLRRAPEGHSEPLMALGGFILVFGFLAFNGGSRLHIARHVNDTEVVANAMKNTVVCASCAGLAGLLLARLGHVAGCWSLQLTVNVTLTGCVAVCAACDLYYTWCAAVVGLMSAPVFLLWSRLINMLNIDDPVDAVSVHLGGGLWGLIAAGLLHPVEGVFYKMNQRSGLQLLWQLLGAVAIAAWTGGIMTTVFVILRKCGIWRVSEEIELKGFDVIKHKRTAYVIQLGIQSLPSRTCSRCNIEDGLEPEERHRSTSDRWAASDNDPISQSDAVRRASARPLPALCPANGVSCQPASFSCALNDHPSIVY